MKRVALPALILSCATSVSAAIPRAEADRLAEAAEVMASMKETVAPEYWARARCVAVIPDLKKAAFVFGGEYGKGMMACKNGDGFSAPLFLQLAKGSWGLQIGGQEIDLVLLVMNESGVQKLLQNKVTLGVDAAVAAGPVGRQAAAGTDAQLKAEILSWSRAAGLFAGIDVSGGVLRPDEDANRAVYGASATPRRILANRDISAPVEAAPFLRALSQTLTTAVASARASAPPVPASPSPTPASPASEAAELRARLATMQQTLDRMLSESRSGPVGTSGNDSASLVTVDRERLVQLRQQIDDLIRTVR